MYDRFVELLTSRGVRAADVARATGLQPSTFSDWKKGKSQPKLEKLQKIADFFDVPLEYFTTGAELDTTHPSAMELTPQEQDLIRLFRSAPSDKQKILTDLVSTAMQLFV